jgi:hypothetical protein
MYGWMDGFRVSQKFFFCLEFVICYDGWDGFSTMFLESGFHYFFLIMMDRWMNG